MVYYSTDHPECGLKHDKRVLDRFDEVADTFAGIGDDLGIKVKPQFLRLSDASDPESELVDLGDIGREEQEALGSRLVYGVNVVAAGSGRVLVSVASDHPHKMTELLVHAMRYPGSFGKAVQRNMFPEGAHRSREARRRMVTVAKRLYRRLKERDILIVEADGKIGAKVCEICHNEGGLDSWL